MARMFLATLVLSICSAASAQDDDQAPPAMGMGMGMGMGMAVSFADLDANGDGVLTKDELGKVIPEDRVDMAMSRWDADGNGEVSKEEFGNRPRRGGMGGQPPAMGGESTEN